ncbi:hypothetical protein [Roseomonas chloroacetimidivorans]|uniref:hypothetical protein n=1 Tax=Roseomonas chloroacetimidivorans TaxID=1766656 RepID=UPI003C71319B
MPVALARRGLDRCARHCAASWWHDHLNVRMTCHDFGIDVSPVECAIRGERCDGIIDLVEQGIAKAKYEGCPPRVVRGSACHAAIAASENHTVRLLRARKGASCAAQFVRRCGCRGMWFRQSWFALNSELGASE